jgi:hypothetical protein
LREGVRMRQVDVVRTIRRFAALSFTTLLACAVLDAGCSGSDGHSGFGEPSSSSGGGSSGAGSGGGSGGSITGGSSGGTGMFGSSSGSEGGVSGDGAVGPIDNAGPCDMGLPIDGAATAFANTIGICTTAASQGYGLVAASYSRAFGSTTPPADAQWGLLPSFGSVITPREGSLLGAISSGYGRVYDDSNGTPESNGNADFVNGNPRDGENYPTGAAPPGFPKAAQGCPQDNLVNDMVDVKLTLKAPPDATGFQFDFDFFSSEWPNYVCSNFNDAFIAYLTSAKITDNISFDSQGNPVAVNISFLSVCTPGTPVGCLRSNGPQPDPPLNNASCTAGPSELGGTGFGDTYETQCDSNNVNATLGASTGWLTTQAPIGGGEQFTLEFMIWDAGDGLLDSSALIDNFQWIGGVPVTTGTQPAQ